MNGNPRKEGA
jgi:hypothetical protein